mmetsp:Transcript_17407/g.19945  ORF Transcript_17407/g.19945 Transcript_17407/m.19945 type:complete len:126 (+) Transcript_17407:724-1101(+)
MPHDPSNGSIINMEKGMDHHILPQTSTIEGAGHVMVPLPKYQVPEGTRSVPELCSSISQITHVWFELYHFFQHCCHSGNNNNDKSTTVLRILLLEGMELILQMESSGTSYMVRERNADPSAHQLL